MIAFRNLKPEEIQVRIDSSSQNGARFLLYKDARCDMDILDETLGPENWQRKHYELKGNMYCSVGINVRYSHPELEPLWVYKDDCGSESNTEKEKGESSDSFKRACVNWGIGRELYTKINIFIRIKTVDTGKTKNNGNKIFVPADPYAKYHVSDIEYEGKKISYIEISDKDGVVAFRYGVSKKPAKNESFKLLCKRCGKEIKEYIGLDGKTVSIEKHCNASTQKFGEILCIDCIQGDSNEKPI